MTATFTQSASYPNAYAPSVDLLDDAYNRQIVAATHQTTSNVASTTSVTSSTAAYYSEHVYPLVTNCIEEEANSPSNQNTVVDDYRCALAVARSENSPSHYERDLYAIATPVDGQRSAPHNTSSAPTEEFYRPSHINSDGSINKNNLPAKVLRFREKRKMRTAASAGAGVVVGAMVLGPVGMVLGGVGGYAIAKKVGKHREKKLLEKCLDREAGGSGNNWKVVGCGFSA